MKLLTMLITLFLISGSSIAADAEGESKKADCCECKADRTVGGGSVALSSEIGNTRVKTQGATTDGGAPSKGKATKKQ